MKEPLPPWRATLRASRLSLAMTASLAPAAWLAALLSGHPWPLRVALAALVTLLVVDECRRDMRRLPCRLEIDAGDRLCFADADGNTHASPLAGHAQLGSLVVFVFAGREGWRRVLGPARIAVWRDAVDEDAFRRLRARLRLG